MRLIGNVLWFVLGGVLIGIAHIVGGVALCLTLIGIPFGIQSMKLGISSFAPFGREVVERENANSALRVVFNVLWIIIAGWEIAVMHIFLAVLFAITILGIPFALQHVKLIPLALFPFGRDLRAAGGAG